MTDLEKVIEQLTRIANSLELANVLTVEGRPAQPARTLFRPLEQYRAFDWGSLHAEVIAADNWGATVVEWNGRQFKRRRSPADDQRGEAIWFSRVWSGTVTERNIVYEKLVCFRDPKPSAEPRPIKGDLAERLATTPAAAQPALPKPKTGPLAPPAPRPLNTAADVLAAIEAGYTAADLAAGMTRANGGTVFWVAVKHWKIAPSRCDAALRNHAGNWQAAILEAAA